MFENVQPIAMEVGLNDTLRARSRERALDIGERLLDVANHQTQGLAGAAGDALAFCALALLTAAGDFEPAWLRMHALDVEPC